MVKLLRKIIGKSIAAHRAGVEHAKARDHYLKFGTLHPKSKIHGKAMERYDRIARGEHPFEEVELDEIYKNKLTLQQKADYHKSKGTEQNHKAVDSVRFGKNMEGHALHKRKAAKHGKAEFLAKMMMKEGFGDPDTWESFSIKHSHYTAANHHYAAQEHHKKIPGWKATADGKNSKWARTAKRTLAWHEQQAEWHKRAASEKTVKEDINEFKLPSISKITLPSPIEGKSIAKKPIDKAKKPPGSDLPKAPAPVTEDAPTNAMGASSSAAGPIQTYDPMLGKKKKLNKIVSRKMKNG